MSQEKSFFERDPHITGAFNEAAGAVSSHTSGEMGTSGLSTTSDTTQSGSLAIDDHLAPKFTATSLEVGVSDDERMEAYARQAIANQKDEVGLRNEQANQVQFKNSFTP